MEGTAAEEVQAPQEVVTLQDLQTSAGQPVQALVRRISQVAIIEAFEGIASPVPQAGVEEGEPGLVASLAQVRRGAGAMARVIEQAVATPRFRIEPSEGELPMDYLTPGDQLLLVRAIKRVAGLKEVPEGIATFRDEDGGGVALRGGVNGTRPDVGAHPVGSGV